MGVVPRTPEVQTPSTATRVLLNSRNCALSLRPSNIAISSPDSITLGDLMLLLVIKINFDFVAQG